MRILKYPVAFIVATAPIAAIASLVGTFFGLGGWGWLLFLWFGFTGMFSLSLLKLHDDPNRDRILISGFSIGLMTAFAGAAYFAVSDLPQRISVWYALLAPLLIFAGLMLRASLTRSAKPKQSKVLVDFSRELESWPRDQAKAALLLVRATLSGDANRINELYPDLTVSQLRSVEQVLKRIEAENISSRP